MEGGSCRSRTGPLFIWLSCSCFVNSWLADSWAKTRSEPWATVSGSFREAVWVAARQERVKKFQQELAWASDVICLSYCHARNFKKCWWCSRPAIFCALVRSVKGIYSCLGLDQICFFFHPFCFSFLLKFSAHFAFYCTYFAFLSNILYCLLVYKFVMTSHTKTIDNKQYT